MIDIEALVREAGAKYELLGDSDEPTRSGWCFEAVATRRMIDAFPSLAAYTNAVLEAAARECDGVAGDADHNKEVRDGAEYCAHAIRALKVTP